MRVIGNLIAHSHEATEMVLKFDIINELKNTLINKYSDIRKEGAWIISNIGAGTVNHIQLILDNFINTMNKTKKVELGKFLNEHKGLKNDVDEIDWTTLINTLKNSNNQNVTNDINKNVTNDINIKLNNKPIDKNKNNIEINNLSSGYIELCT